MPAACESSDLGTHGSFETVALTLVVEAEVWVKESIVPPYAKTTMIDHGLEGASRGLASKPRVVEAESVCP